MTNRGADRGGGGGGAVASHVTARAVRTVRDEYDAGPTADVPDCPVVVPDGPVVVPGGPVEIGGVELSELATAWGQVDPAHLRDLGAREASEILVRLATLRSTIAAIEDHAMLALDVRLREQESGKGLAASRQGRSTAHHISLASRISPAQASRRLAAARRLVRDMPRIHAALATGRLPAASALAIGSTAGPLSPPLRERIDRVVAEHLPHLEAASTRQWSDEVDLIAHRLDPAGFAQRHARARTERSVSIVRHPHGMARLHATLPGLDAAAIGRRLSLEAERLRAAGDRRGHGRIMADLLADTLLGRDEAMDPIRLDVGVILTDRMLLEGGEGAATIEGYGTVPAGALIPAIRRRASGRRATGGGPVGSGTTPADDRDRVSAAVEERREEEMVLRRLYTAPRTGELVAVESRARAFPPALARMIRLGQRGCASPYCGAPIRHIDHIRPFVQGGATELENGEGMCGGCNGTKDQVATVQVASAHAPDSTAGGSGREPRAPRTVEWRSRFGVTARRSGTPLEGRAPLGGGESEPEQAAPP